MTLVVWAPCEDRVLSDTTGALRAEGEVQRSLMMLSHRPAPAGSGPEAPGTFVPASKVAREEVSETEI